jgi:hypothetical protein
VRRLTPELADALFDEVSEGGSMINQLRVHNIDARTFYRWLRNNPDFATGTRRRLQFVRGYSLSDSGNCHSK